MKKKFWPTFFVMWNTTKVKELFLGSRKYIDKDCVRYTINFFGKGKSKEPNFSK